MEQSSQPAKAIWLAILVVALAALIFFVLIQKGKKTAAPSPTPPVTENSSQTDTATPAATPSSPSSSSSIPMAEAQKQFQTIQDQVNAGTLSAEEAKKQMDALGAQVAPPELPAEAQK